METDHSVTCMYSLIVMSMAFIQINIVLKQFLRLGYMDK